ncbi:MULTISPECIES: helix-turn-helix transcriptional regulator [unclassified Modestobacter]|uniref:helix-turn-helix transcriptional regulator n=1 Tax=unclassified Modestobacter TaxID=2643866 RepID=UPI0022AA6D51|nr:MULTISPECIES: WYL domain-containing protein [unclassified Modestobacter]MCZ2823070.1 WYL domain-containing protein [Modestobacter sp. VKM Ac-2981]MCZ2851316.1 WYL domain-containing protein [Modestobacter sp. VKM Ac-2982]
MVGLLVVVVTPRCSWAGWTAVCHRFCHGLREVRTLKRAERLHALSEMLRRNGARGCTAERLATEFDVSVRTVKRDLAALENSGAPIWSRPGPGGGYGWTTGGSLPPVSLSPAQAVALLAAVSAAPDAPYGDLASAAVQKIVDVLDPRTRARADELARRVWVNAPPPRSRAVTSALEAAMAEQRVVRIRYTSSEGTTTTRDVEPVLFASTNGQWHLIGWCRLRNAMRWFTVSRIERASTTTIACGGHTIHEVGTPPANARPVHGSSH